MDISDTKAKEGIKSGIEEDVVEPLMYKVLLHNDDYTTMDFVVDILMSVFNKSADRAVEIMLNVHHKGIGLCGIYICEVAETKVKNVHVIARENGFPLKCSMEKD